MCIHRNITSIITQVPLYESNRFNINSTQVEKSLLFVLLLVKAGTRTRAGGNVKMVVYGIFVRMARFF